MQGMSVSIVGMSMLISMMESTRTAESESDMDKTKPGSRADGSSIQLGEDKAMNENTKDGLLRLSMILGLVQKSRATAGDNESKGHLNPMPGDPKWSGFLRERIKVFGQSRKDVMLKRLFIYMNFNTGSTAAAILDAVDWADDIVKDGSMEQDRIILPRWRGTKKLFWPFHEDVETTTSDFSTPIHSVQIGDSLKLYKMDPEHLSPVTLFENWTDPIRAVPGFFSYTESGLGFCAAVGTMSIGILAFLRTTRSFFVEQWIQWPLVMISISIMGDVGSSLYNFFLRILGAVVTVFISLGIWYICDQNQPAIIFLFHLCQFIGIYFLVKFPHGKRSTIISLISLILIIGYETQVRQIGVARATASGQPYYPIYLLAPYRLLIVCGGLAVACFWVHFPYPTTTHEAFRKDVGAMLLLLANFYSSTISTLNLGLESHEISKEEKRALQHTCLRNEEEGYIFVSLCFSLSCMSGRVDTSRYEPILGGRFPKNTYNKLIQWMQKTFKCVAMMSHSVNVMETGSPDEAESVVHRDLSLLGLDTKTLCRELTSLLCSVAASVTNAQPLPLYLQLPDLGKLRKRMDTFDFEVFTANILKILAVLHSQWWRSLV